VFEIEYVVFAKAELEVPVPIPQTIIRLMAEPDCE